jgi:hypothetical protein
VILRDVGLVRPLGERGVDDQLAQLLVGVGDESLRLGDELRVVIGDFLELDLLDLILRRRLGGR